MLHIRHTSFISIYISNVIKTQEGSEVVDGGSQEKTKSPIRKK